ncbi:hypothetical protein VSP10_10570 [Myroides odoratimimus]|nr:hypothetical protein [Myroides odoratimimus]
MILGFISGDVSGEIISNNVLSLSYKFTLSNLHFPMRMASERGSDGRTGD